MRIRVQRSSWGVVLVVVLAALPLLACVTLPWQLSQGTQTTSIPRWTCPTPMPKPYGEAGPIKGHEDGPPDPTTGIPVQKPIYYQEWEQENFTGNGPPFPAPTPDVHTGSNFQIGQIVNLTRDLDVRGDVRRTDIVSGNLRLSEAVLQFTNRGAPLMFTPARQVVISAVVRPDGTQVMGDGWGWDVDAARLDGRADDGATSIEIPTGTAQREFVVPIFAPDGVVQTLDLQLDLAVQGGETANGALRVQWMRPTVSSNCGADGVVKPSYADPARPVDAPPPPANASDVVQWAFTQLDRPYCWGGKGWDNCNGYGGGAQQVTPSCASQGGSPCWDCSGLTWGAYKAVGVIIGAGTGNQSHYPAVWQVGDSTDPASVAQPGDLLLFTGVNANGRPAGRITHVALYAGNGLMIHAANYPDGVIPTPNVFSNRYYKPLLAVITRPPRH